MRVYKGKDNIDITKAPVSSVLKRARDIATSTFKVQVAGVGWNVVGGIYFQVRPYLTADHKLDDISTRRAAWGLPSFRAPHFTAGYFAKPLNRAEVSRLKALIGEYQATEFGDLSVDELQVVAYEDYSFNAGYRVLETIPLEDEVSLPTRIARLVLFLAQNGITPGINGQTLKEALAASSPLEMVSYIKHNSILSNEEDILRLLEVKQKNLAGQKLSDEDKEMLMLYRVILEGGIDRLAPVTVFSGGSGSNRITEGLSKQGVENLTLLLNAYDDGKSTGDIRRNFGVLGPSDIGKNFVVLLKNKQPVLARFLDYRFGKDADPKELREYVAALANGGGSGEVNLLFQTLDVQTKEKLKRYFTVFLEQIRLWEQANQRSYNFRDYGIRNMMFLAAYFMYGQDYTKAIDGLISDFNLSGRIVLNNYEPLWLVAVTEDGQLLNSEAAVVDGMLGKEIAGIFLVKTLLSEDEVLDFKRHDGLAQKLKFIERTFAVYPEATKESVHAIMQAKAVILAPTTFHSSLSPTLITKGVPEALKRSTAPKILIANLMRERGRHTVGEAIGDITRYMNHGLGAQGTNVLDYVVLNTHGYQTNGVSNANRLPIDIDRIHQERVEPIVINVDPNSQGKHQGDITAQVVMTLEGIEALGYSIHQGRLVKKSKVDWVTEGRRQLKKLLASPILYGRNSDRVEHLTAEILGISSLEEFVPKQRTRAVIVAAGQATRLGADMPKFLFPVEGKPNLVYLMDSLAGVDQEPLLAIKEADMPYVRQWLREYPSYHPKLCVIPSGKGTAVALKDLEDVIQKEGIENVLMLWGDVSNLKPKSLRMLLAVHEALGTSSMTIPTSWEQDPYAGLIRNEQGEITDVFVTKEDPRQKKLFAEHDGSLFLFNYDQTIPFVHQAIEKSGFNQGRISAVNFLKTIPLMAKAGKEIYGIASMDPRETAGFNTQEEAGLVAQYKQELRDGVPIKQNDMERMILSARAEEKAVNITDEMKQAHKDRLNAYMARHYEGLVLDVDDTLTESGVVPQALIDKLVETANQGKPVGFITGRTNDSLEKLLLARIRNHPKLNGSALKNFYVYLENGTYGFRLDQGAESRFYEYKMSSNDTEVASYFLRKIILGYKDNYSITKYKIHLWPYEPFKQGEYMARIKELFRVLGLPFTAFKSNSVETTGSILITRNGTSKANALDDFLRRTSIDTDHVVKIGDLAGVGCVDYDLLRGAGSFTVGEFDPESMNQVAMRLVLPEGSNAARTLAVLEAIKFEPAIPELAIPVQDNGRRLILNENERAALERSLKAVPDKQRDIARLTYYEHIRRLRQRPEPISLAQDKWLQRLKSAYEWLVNDQQLKTTHIILNRFGNGDMKRLRVKEASDDFERQIDMTGQKFIIYSGGSGVGKSTILAQMTSTEEGRRKYRKFLMYTTRPMRSAEDELLSKPVTDRASKLYQLLRGLATGKDADISTITVKNVDLHKEKWLALVSDPKEKEILARLLDLRSIGREGMRISIAPHKRRPGVVSEEVSLAERFRMVKEDDAKAGLKTGDIQIFGEFDGVDYYFIDASGLDELVSYPKAGAPLIRKFEIYGGLVQGVCVDDVKEAMARSGDQEPVMILDTTPEIAMSLKKELGRIQTFLLAPFDVNDYRADLDRMNGLAVKTSHSIPVGGVDIQGISYIRKSESARIEFDDQSVRDALKDGFNGFTPVIMNITPVVDPMMIFGDIPF